MQSATPEDTQRKPVIPLFELVVYPESRTKFQVDRVTGEGPDRGHAGRRDRAGPRPDREERHRARGPDRRLVLPDGHPAPGHAHPAGRGRVRGRRAGGGAHAGDLARRRRRAVLGSLRAGPDVQDLEDDEKALALDEIRSAIHEISGQFNGAEQFTKPIDRMDTVDQVMGFVMPFMPVELEEKQALLESVSVQAAVRGLPRPDRHHERGDRPPDRDGPEGLRAGGQVEPRGDAPRAAPGDPGGARRERR